MTIEEPRRHAVGWVGVDVSGAGVPQWMLDELAPDDGPVASLMGCEACDFLAAPDDLGAIAAHVVANQTAE